MTIIHEPTSDEPWVVASKEAGLPTAPLFEGDRSAFTQVAALFPQVLGVKGKKEVEGGLIHRLDTETEGLFMCATSQEFYDFIQNEQKEGRFIKTYEAITDAIPCTDESFAPFKTVDSLTNPGNFTVESYFRTYGVNGSAVRPVTEESGKAALKKCQKKAYRTTIRLEGNRTEGRAVCSISAGFRHQVRCHLAWSGHPVKGDQLYNPTAKEGEKLLFKAVSLSFFDENGEIRTYSI